MCESIEIILPCIAHDHGIDSFPQEFDRLIANEILASRVDELTGEGLGESELMIKFPEYVPTTNRSLSILQRSVAR